MNKADLVEGMVVIIPSGQAGTISYIDSDIYVFLANGDLWHGTANMIHEPQSREHLDACPLNVDRFEERERQPRILRDND